MTDDDAQRIRGGVILIAHIPLALLFLIFGLGKLTDHAETVVYMTQSGVPAPPLATSIALIVESIGAILVILGTWTRPCSDYTCDENASIMGGILLLYITGQADTRLMQCWQSMIHRPLRPQVN